jgi:hypothetical protein
MATRAASTHCQTRACPGKDDDGPEAERYCGSVTFGRDVVGVDTVHTVDTVAVYRMRSSSRVPHPGEMHLT